MSNCIICNNSFEPRNSRQLNCSKECSLIYKRKKNCEYDKTKSKNIIGSKRECAICNIGFIVKIHNAKFCSSKCKHEQRKIRLNERYHNDIEFKIKHNLRSRIYKAIKFDRDLSAISELGCSIEDLKKHLESQFDENMNWNNYGEWHIDHIKPLCSFELKNNDEFKEACHYTNLQPLWAKDNLKKLGRIYEEIN